MFWCLYFSDCDNFSEYNKVKYNSIVFTKDVMFFQMSLLKFEEGIAHFFENTLLGGGASCHCLEA